MMITEDFKTEIYEDYRPKVLAFMTAKVQNRERAEDLCEDVFVKIYAKIEDFDETRSSLSTWIYTIAQNTLTDYFRTNRFTTEIPEFAQSSHNVEEEVLNNETLERLATLLSQMEERQRDVIILRFYDGKTLREIAETLSISYAYVKILQNKAFAFLKENLLFQ